MSQIGTLVAGAGVVTPIDLEYCPAIITIGSTFTENPLSGLSITVSGVNVIEIQNTNLLTGWMNYMMTVNVSAIALTFCIKVANGYLRKQNTQLRFTNAAASTPNIYAFSKRFGSKAVLASTNSVVALANQQVNRFTVILIDPTNFDSAQITFSDGFNDRFTAVDIQTMFAMCYPNDGGQLDNVLAIDNRLGNISQVQIYATGGGSVPYLVSIF